MRMSGPASFPRPQKSWHTSDSVLPTKPRPDRLERSQFPTGARCHLWPRRSPRSTFVPSLVICAAVGVIEAIPGPTYRAATTVRIPRP